ncbi:helix-turn-helix protein [Hydrogenispora ethanolica]|uniref:Helix-turn-helix protein n=1 Tax=Hydrogenispora ethanolica TaxID=1082276 RepID=A0A4R1QUY2_HYDET|nr:response regulator [Hydrogenispora ethanolica]TCL54754.1 helix-turn-helix protein [Hydrogenispora ethanolica]
MYRLMIVDDEPIVLKAISHVVETSCQEMEIVGRTGSGMEAVALALREKPDILMIDIELTGLNGLDAAAEIKKALPDLLIVIISAYDNFQYAKQGITLGVMDYLLKPVARDDIIAILGAAARRLEEQRSKAREQLELKDRLSKMKPFLEEDLFFTLLYPGTGRHSLGDYPQLLDLHFAHGQAIEVSGPDSGRLTEGFERYKQLIRNQLAGVRNLLFGPVIGRTSLLLLGYDNLPPDPPSQWRQIQQRFQSELDFSATIILGRILPGFDGMVQSFQELRRLAWQHDSRPGGVYRIEELPPSGRQELSVLYQDEQEFFEAMKQGQGELAQLIFGDLHRLATAVLGSDLPSLKDYFRGIIAVLRWIFYENAPAGAKQCWDGQEALRQINRSGAPAEIGVVFDGIIRELTHLIAGGAFPEKNPEIRAAVAFMEQNYHRDLTLPDIAAAVAISPGYLTKLFKEYRNQTVMDLLERIRIEQGLKLLKETALSIKEIAGRVGYRDPNYFSKVFKKVTNASPTEIRHEQTEARS